MNHWACIVCGKSIWERTKRVRKFCSKACDREHDKTVQRKAADSSPRRTRWADQVVAWNQHGDAVYRAALGRVQSEDAQ
jgi:hypothetical protein